MLVNYKGEISKCTVGKPGRRHLHQAVKANVVNNEMNWNSAPLIGCSENTEVSLRRKQNFKPTVRKTLHKSGVGDPMKCMTGSLQKFEVTRSRTDWATSEDQRR